MSRLILSIVLFLSGSTAYAEDCTQMALVRGRAVHVSNCTYQIDFSYYADSLVCPIGRSRAVQLAVQDDSCSVIEGQEVEGVLQRSGDFWTLGD